MNARSGITEYCSATPTASVRGDRTFRGVRGEGFERQRAPQEPLAKGIASAGRRKHTRRTAGCQVEGALTASLKSSASSVRPIPSMVTASAHVMYFPAGGRGGAVRKIPP